jgi:hypothetical protein
MGRRGLLIGLLGAAALLCAVPASSRSTSSFSVAATGGGTVTIKPQNMVCPPSCLFDVSPGTDLLLTAKAGKGGYLKRAVLSTSYSTGPAGSTVYLRIGTTDATGYTAYTNRKIPPISPEFLPTASVINPTADTFAAGQITLRWSHPIGSLVSTDVIRRFDGPKCGKTVLDGQYMGFGTFPSGGSWQASFVDTTVTPGATYCYAVHPLTQGAPGRPANVSAVAPGSSTSVPPPTVLAFKPLAALPGAVVKLTGTNLLETTAVKFTGYGGSPTADTYWPESPTTLDVVVPSVARAGPITVETPSGTAETSAFAIPLPAVKSFAPASAHVGDWIMLKGTLLLNVNTVEFGTSGAAQHDTLSQTLMRVRVPGDATTGPIMLQTPNGETTSAASFTVLP